MGTTGDVIPDATLTNVYEMEFSLLRAIIGDKLPGLDAEASD
jgi:hypothetical protein